MVLKYEEDKKTFTASVKEDTSLARFLSTPPPKEEAPVIKPQLKPAPVVAPTPELCPQHGRPLELICVVDKQRVCAQCALFGTHRGHDVR